MKLNKDKFLKTELGAELESCIKAWDYYLTKRSELNDLEQIEKLNKSALWCQAQWEVYKMAIRQFYGVEYFFTRTDDYYGLVTEDYTDWLFKVERKD